MLGALGPARRRGGAGRGFTVIELMVVVALVAVILALAAPSMYDYLVRQRVAGINAELVTDLELARSEAIARNADVYVTFRVDDDSMTCYTIHTLANFGRCDCRKPIGTACLKSDGTPYVGAHEIKTVQVPRSTNAVLVPPAEGYSTSNQVIFSKTRGMIDWQGHRPLTPSGDDDFANYVANWAHFSVGVESPRGGRLRTQINITGRPQVCSPDGSFTGVPRCGG